MPNKNYNQPLYFEQALNQMKTEISQELNVNLGPDTTSRQNGTVGGEITRRLIDIAKQNLR